jgi:hypothetical protein
MKQASLFLFLLLCSCSQTPTKDLVRLDQYGVEPAPEEQIRVNVFLTEACSICDRQVQVLKECIVAENVAAFLEGKNEDHLRKVLRRKKLPFATYFLTDSVKKTYGFSGRSPALAIRTRNGHVFREGLQECEEIIRIIKIGMH